MKTHNCSATAIKEYSQRWTILLMFIMGFFVLSLGIIKYSNYEKGYLTSDIVMYMNAFSNTSVSEGSILSTRYHLESLGFSSLLQDHFAPTLTILASIYHLFPSAYFLLSLQAIAPAVTAIILYKTALIKELGPKLSLLVAVVYLFHPSVVLATLDFPYGFHQDSLLPPLAVGAAFSMFTGNSKTFVCLVLLALGLKETVFASAMIIGPFLLATKRYNKYGLALIVLGFVSAVLSFLIIPHIMNFENRHLTKLTNNVWAIGSLLHYIQKVKENCMYWFALSSFWPSILFPTMILATLPEMFSSAMIGWRPTTWHFFLPMSLLALGTIQGLQKLRTNSMRFTFWAKCFLVSTIATSFLGAWALFSNGQKQYNLRNRVDRDALEKVLKTVPNAAVIAATSDMAIHFANHKNLISVDPKNADFMVINCRQPYLFESDRELAQEMELLHDKSQYSLLIDISHIKVYAKNH